MQDIIHLLPDSLANQIAAGEVVQRPSSVVKELMENAIDAKSDEIKLYIKDAGKTLIQVIDNGLGMSETDLRLSIERHTTSKITKTEDIYNISTFGFRGEALASICAVAQVDMKSKQLESEVGSFLLIEGSKVINQEPISASVGTNISIKNLFFNVPARRKFLKSDSIEIKHIIEEFQRIALANSEVEMSFYQDGSLIYKLAKTNVGKRIINIFGESYKNNLLPCREEVQDIKIQGYIGKPELSRKTRGGQLFFVNNRFVKHGYLHHAVMNAFEGLLAEDKYPFYVIFINMNPKDIDINIHPTKMEVKFQDDRTLYVILEAMLKRVLSSQGIVPQMDFQLDTNILLSTKSKDNLDSKISKPKHSTLNPNIGSKPSFSNPYPKTALHENEQNWQKLFENPNIDLNLEEQLDNKTIILKSRMDGIALEEKNIQSFKPENVKNKTIFIDDTFVLYQVKSGLIIVDQIAALERIFYDRFLKRFEKKTKNPQQMIFPKKLILNPIDMTLLSDFKDELNKMGFVIEFLNKNELLIKATPSELKSLEEQVLIEELLEQIKINKPLDLNIGQRLANFLAKQAIKQKHHITDSLEIHKLIDLLFQTSNPYYTSEGKKILTLLNIETLKKWFQK